MAALGQKRPTTVSKETYYSVEDGSARSLLALSLTKTNKTQTHTRRRRGRHRYIATRASRTGRLARLPARCGSVRSVVWGVLVWYVAWGVCGVRCEVCDVVCVMVWGV